MQFWLILEKSIRTAEANSSFYVHAQYGAFSAVCYGRSRVCAQGAQKWGAIRLLSQHFLTDNFIKLKKSLRKMPDFNILTTGDPQPVWVRTIWYSALGKILQEYSVTSVHFSLINLKELWGANKELWRKQKTEDVSCENVFFCEPNCHEAFLQGESFWNLFIVASVKILKFKFWAWPWAWSWAWSWSNKSSI